MDATRPTPLPSDTTLPVDPAEVPGILGEALAPHGAALQSMVRDLRRNKVFRSAHFRTLQKLADAVARLSVTSQQISRIETGRLRQSHERLDLVQVMQDLITQNAARFAELGLHVQTQFKADVEVIVDPGLLVSLLEAGLLAQAAQGGSLTVRLHLRNWPEHAVITLVARPGVDSSDTTAPAPPRDTPDWVLLLQLARAMGVTVQRELVGREVLLSLEFPRTVKKLEGLTAMELDAGHDGFAGTGFGGTAFGGLSESRPVAGHRVLLITEDRGLREEVGAICRDMGLQLDSAPTSTKAVRSCELDKPDLILVDERQRDERFEELRQDLQRYDVNFPVVELSRDAHTVEMASWMGNSVSRIGRAAMREQLPSLLVMELAKVV